MERRQLASVKHQMYHPRLPSLRRMDMDTVIHRLSTEHARHTTYCTKNEFANIRTTLRPGSGTLHCKNVIDSDTKSKITNYKKSNEEKQQNTLQATTNNTLPLESNRLYYRKLHPNITSSWKNALEVKYHQIKPQAIKPLPALIYNRYRNTSRPYSAYPWY